MLLSTRNKDYLEDRYKANLSGIHLLDDSKLGKTYFKIFKILSISREKKKIREIKNNFFFFKIR